VQAPAAQAIPAGAELSRQEPARPATFAADLLVPLGQAVTSGLLLGGLAAFVANRAGYHDWPALWLGLGLGISAVAWLVLLGQHRRLLWAIETVTGKDLDKDGKTGKPAERLVIVNAPQAQEQSAKQERAARRSAFAAFVAALPTRGTDARTWEPELGRQTYQEFRDTLIRVGWAKLKGRGEKRGWALAVPVADILARIE